MRRISPPFSPSAALPVHNQKRARKINKKPILQERTLPRPHSWQRMGFTPILALILAVPLNLPLQAIAADTINTSLKSSTHPQEDATPFQKGIASWYGGQHTRHKRTAQGERFNPNALTAAHPFLPFGTKLLVRSQRTGKSVIVRINDRGPYVKNRIIDLSRSAAERLGILKSGIASVTVSILATKSRTKWPKHLPPHLPKH